MQRNLREDVREIVNFLLPRNHVPLPLELREIILEFSGLLHVGRRSLIWYRCF